MDVRNDSTTGKMGVLGIGLVMEEVGKGARLVFRYPASPPPYFTSSSNRQTGGGKNSEITASVQATPRESPTSTKSRQKDEQSDSGISSAHDSIDLFFDLPARVISKLFRPKRPLCGQPLTLNISGTTFCCRAELFDNLQTCPSTVGGDGNEHPLVLFSVIVALAPLEFDSTETRYKLDKNSTFTTIERVHRNLGRLCKVLTREERRCQYVTLQCQMLLTVRKDYEDRFILSSGGKNNEANQPTLAQTDESATNTRRASNSSTPNVAGAQMKSNDKRSVSQTHLASNNVGDAKATSGMYSSDSGESKKKMSKSERREYIQQLIELMFASSPPDSNHGNLARELAAVFHFLSKYDDPESPVTASAVVSRALGKDIYINRHVAVPFESTETVFTQPELNPPASKFSDQTDGQIVNSYQTLLFPYMSPSEVIRALSDDSVNLSFSVGSSTSTTDISPSVSMSHAIRRMLSQLHPRKTLKEVALDSALTTHQVLEAAKWFVYELCTWMSEFFLLYFLPSIASRLVNSGMCVTAMPVTRKSRYACVEGVVDKMKALAVPFWQAFSAKSQHCQFIFDGCGKKTVVTGAPHIFLIVGALTSNAVTTAKNETEPTHAASAPTLGDVINSLTGSDELDRGAEVQYRREIESSTNSFRFDRPKSHGSTSQHEESSIENVVYSMAVWLNANHVIFPVDC